MKNKIFKKIQHLSLEVRNKWPGVPTALKQKPKREKVVNIHLQ
jgi:hypothetical protein